MAFRGSIHGVHIEAFSVEDNIRPSQLHRIGKAAPQTALQSDQACRCGRTGTIKTRLVAVELNTRLLPAA